MYPSYWKPPTGQQSDDSGGRDETNADQSHGHRGGRRTTHPQPITLQIRSGCAGGGKGALMQTDKSATLSTHNAQTLFDPIPIADKATRYKGGGDTRNNDGSANGLGIGEPGAPANTLTAADRHGVACFAQQAIGRL